jgi:hypothetical protein
LLLAVQPAASDWRFAAFMAAIVVSMTGGYLLRRAGRVRPEHARGVMSAAIIACDAPIAWLAIWHLVIDPQVWKVPVAGAAVGVAVCLLGLVIARLVRMRPQEAAVFAMQGGMGNVGYTMGGAICLALWGIQGLALEQMFVLMWPFFAFLFCFPIGRHYGEAAAGARDAGSLPLYALRTLVRSLTDIRSLPLYMATLGLALNLAGTTPPQAIRRWHIIDVLMLAGMALSFGGVGMTVHARRLPAWWKTAVGSAALKFIASPLLMLAAAWAMGLGGMPLAVCLILAAMPTALYSVLMANLFGLNRDLANTTFLLTHIVCLAAIAAAALLVRAGLPLETWMPGG